MANIQDFMFHFEQLNKVSQELGFGDPFNYSRGKEIYTALYLKHKVSETLAGADAYDDEGACEYKSTTSKTIKATYNGISVKQTWEEQVKYLKEEKIGKYKNHYLARFNKLNQIEEIWWLDGGDVAELAIKKLHSKFHKKNTKADPRLGFSLTKKEIEEYGIRIH